MMPRRMVLALTTVLSVTVAAPAPADSVAVTRAEYVVKDGILTVQATGSNGGATLKAYVTSSGQLIGTLTNTGGGGYQGQLAWPTNPQNVTVQSSLGGSGTAAVAVK